MSTLILIAFHARNNNNYVTYLDSFGVEHIHKEIKAFIGKKTLKQTFSEDKHMIR